ncbi:M81 family metallopeptidase [Actinokineospora auranticolor]|uniref:Microcystin degradation protein MlrC n=1 Tax=Actinokineospora auranticolor TaxID=155976 RepID=A0A2S6GHZ6_9PSEU|nr:M81 family metallopeptidase [Actinokineospora auranticolor]PPK64837.1 microcystin degradation protein MlrC [Actinokineospora auranticolor]
MTRALIAGLVHESSTFMVEVMGPTTADDFTVHAGSDLVAAFADTNTVVGGYLAACARHRAAGVPALHARAEPGAALAQDAVSVLLERLLDRASRVGAVDVVLLDLHGAGATAAGESVDLVVLRAVRAMVGTGVPIAATLDLHGNVGDEVAAIADVVVGYQEYPHTDMAARAERAADIAFAQRAGRARPVTAVLRLPMLIPPSTTASGAAADARDLARAAEAESGVLACTVFHGFPYADTPQTAVSVATVVDGDRAHADRVNRRLADWLWAHRADFTVPTRAPEEVVPAALSAPTFPVVIGDGTDNPGCGAPGDGTYLLRALLDHDARACFATIHDPAAVSAAIAAGVGARVPVALGGRHGWASGPPVEAEALVRSITDGRVVQQAMRRGKALDFGRCARLRVGTVDVVVATRRSQVFDPEILLLHGIDPARYDLVAVKSVTHFRAGFAAVAADLVVADAPGPLSRDITALPRTGPTAARWPVDPGTRFPTPNRPRESLR